MMAYCQMCADKEVEISFLRSTIRIMEERNGRLIAEQEGVWCPNREYHEIRKRSEKEKG